MGTDLTMSFTVEQTPQEVFDAVTDVRSWWSGSIVGDTTTLGAEWVYTVPDIHFSKFRTTRLDAGSRVEWLVLDSHLTFPEDKQEWTGTTVRFDIAREPADAAAGDPARTRLTFTHVGLHAGHECFDVCRTAWSQYVLGSLRDRVLTGAGVPDAFSNQESLEAALAGTAEVPVVS
ncbi:SRPBCC domain-containing protein [Intrasporangium sp. YIM S08009]|uniref:SRPBCC domain-containing protein n=1 Tax=Intrasporangium zincisolvens TaxID=3080018 RepID=UPI002B057E44|nr:SRPBCC domain-containing protein [Intrasporangium sp. YIM S08009]